MQFDFGGAGNDYAALTRQYWNAWQDLARQGAAAAGLESPQAPWHEGVEQWARLFNATSKTPDAHSDVVQRVLAGAKSYMAMMQSLIGAASAQPEAPAASAWTEAFKSGLNMPGIDAGLANNPLAAALRDISGKGAQGFEEMMARFAPLAESAMGEAKGWLKLPAFGLMREHQEHYQAMVAAMIDYREADAHYNALLLKASQRGFELFELKLAEREEPGRQIDSVRALYDLWVDAAEEAYAEIALSHEFRKVYGALVNAQMRARASLQKEVERVCTDLGMPTRTELDTIGQRLQETRRQLKRQARDGGSDASAQIEALRREVAQLKAQVADDRRARTTAEAAPARAAVKTVTRAPAKPVAKKTVKAAVKPAAKSAAKRASKPTGKPASFAEALARTTGSTAAARKPSKSTKR